MIRRPFIFLALVMALLLGFMLGYIVAVSDLDFAALRELLGKIPLAERVERPRPGGTETADKAAAPKPEPAPAPSEAGEAQEALLPVLRIVDGDTIHVRLDGRDETVRLLRVNTPERGQSGYNESIRALRGLLEDEQVRLEFETRGKPERDRYDRLLAYVFVDGKNLSVEMVRLGWTPYWTRYGRGRYATAFDRAQREAIAARRGMWATSKNKTR